MPSLLCTLAYLHVNGVAWPDNLANQENQTFKIGNSSPLGPNEKDPEHTFYLYCRPSGHLSTLQPLLIENPACNSDGGCRVGFIDIDKRRGSDWKTMYPTQIAYIKAPQAARIWQTAMRLADSPKAHEQGLTLDDWAEVSDILDAVTKPVEEWQLRKTLQLKTFQHQTRPIFSWRCDVRPIFPSFRLSVFPGRAYSWLNRYAHSFPAPAEGGTPPHTRAMTASGNGPVCRRTCWR